MTLIHSFQLVMSIGFELKCSQCFWKAVKPCLGSHKDFGNERYWPQPLTQCWKQIHAIKTEYLFLDTIRSFSECKFVLAFVLDPTANCIIDEWFLQKSVFGIFCQVKMSTFHRLPACMHRNKAIIMPLSPFFGEGLSLKTMIPTTCIRSYLKPACMLGSKQSLRNLAKSNLRS